MDNLSIIVRDNRNLVSCFAISYIHHRCTFCLPHLVNHVAQVAVKKCLSYLRKSTSAMSNVEPEFKFKIFLINQE